MTYNKSTLYVTGTAKIAKTDPIASLYDVFFVGLIVDRTTHKIVDFTSNMVRDVTSEFIKELLLGFNLVDQEAELLMEIKERFHGLAQKTLLASIKDARNRYLNIIQQ